ncbi:peptidase [Massilia sp. KIM]|uniref:PepSY-associated TM helix domain-containing protein n=1 Tax=Massilia sp. KIM TaxID=1955422 RepID=UPI00098FE102|nr:PepSY-associated TM helix domain-containing protein [Massilia sp. KIM]OON62056.1 peptidase [Massilia sp. KIM]
MTRQRTLNMLFTIHSWAGIVTGLLMFIVCFSGAVVVFKHEIDLWANPVLAEGTRTARMAPLDDIVRKVHEAYPTSTLESVWFPDDVNPNVFVLIREHDQPANQRTKLALRSDNGEVMGPVDSQLGQFLRMLHVFLFVGPRWIVGFLGVTMLVLIGTGVVIHRKIIAELFTQRWGRSLRVVMSDLHKAAGVWGLAFHIMIAFTGAWLGLAPVFERGFDYATQSNKVQPAKRPEPAPAVMQSLDAMHAKAAQVVPGFKARFVSLRNWGMADAHVAFAGRLEDHLASTARVEFNGASGAIKSLHDPRHKGFWSQFNGLMEPLHFGDFGGLVLKWLYFLLGLTPAFLSLSGTLIWLDGREQRRRPATASSHAGRAA